MKQASFVLQLPISWQAVLSTEIKKSYFSQLQNFLNTELANDKVIFPSSDNVFAALETTAFDNVKIVILGQDPYHGIRQAHGLSFSVPDGIKIPPSLMNIIKELQSDMGMSMPSSGCLQAWAEQGVLLLNSVLTVEQGLAASHQNKGWEVFTDEIIVQLNQQKEHLVFLLWGAYAQKKGALINKNKHFVLEAPHPSPLSAHRGFLGCKHFSQANAYLKQHGLSVINWHLGKSLF